MIDVPPGVPPLPDRPVAEALVDCGLVKSGFKVTYAKDLQENVIEISLRAGANSKNLQCIWNATWAEFVQFEDKELQAAYDEITQSRFQPIAQQQAREALAKRGLLEGLPEKRSFSSLADFAVAIEQHCGFSAHQVLRVTDNMITFDPRTDPGSLDYDKSACIFAALVASGETKFGIIGNEASGD